MAGYNKAQSLVTRFTARGMEAFLKRFEHKAFLLVWRSAGENSGENFWHPKADAGNWGHEK